MTRPWKWTNKTAWIHSADTRPTSRLRDLPTVDELAQSLANKRSKGSQKVTPNARDRELAEGIYEVLSRELEDES
jgi:hypothetical protein